MTGSEAGMALNPSRTCRINKHEAIPLDLSPDRQLDGTRMEVLLEKLQPGLALYHHGLKPTFAYHTNPSM